MRRCSPCSRCRRLRPTILRTLARLATARPMAEKQPIKRNPTARGSTSGESTNAVWNPGFGSRKNGVEESFGRHLAEHGDDEHEGRQEQTCDVSDHDVCGAGSDRSITDLVMEEEELSELH